MTNYEMKEELGASEALIVVISRIVYKKEIDYSMKHVTMDLFTPDSLGREVRRKEVVTYDLDEALEFLQERLERLELTCNIKEQKAVEHTKRMITELEGIIKDCEAFNIDTGI